MMLFGLPMTVATMLLSEKIMILVAGPEFAASGAPLRILALTVFAVYVGAIYGHTAVAINKQKQTMWVYMSCAVITLIAYLLLIPRFGMNAAAWLTVFSEIYVGIFLTLTVHRYLAYRLQLKTFSKIIFSTAVMGVVLFLLRDLHVIALILIGSAVYGNTLLLVKAVSKETIREIISVKK
jgi:O-antigen/teichoic acid export membrane protein